MNETLVMDRPFDLRFAHRAIGAIRHRDGRSIIDCQCGRGVTDLTAAATQARWNQHIAEEADR